LNKVSSSSVNSGPVFLILIVVTSVLLTMAYDHVARNLRIRLLTKLIPPPGNKRLSAKENKEERAKQRKLQEDITYYHSTSFSLLYNTLFYLTLSVFLGFYLLRPVPNLYNYVLTTCVSGGLVMLSSTSK